jgi:hypothetical protein
VVRTEFIAEDQPEIRTLHLGLPLASFTGWNLRLPD